MVARPRQSDEEGGYIRKGRFKEGLQPHFTYNLSLRAEEIFETSNAEVGDMEQRYINALAQAVEESNALRGQSGNIRIAITSC